jgi:hypothetical protein
MKETDGKGVLSVVNGHLFGLQINFQLYKAFYFVINIMKNINKITKIKETYSMVDNVNNPAHYTIGKGVETIESIEHQLSTDQFRGYLKETYVSIYLDMRKKIT